MRAVVRFLQYCILRLAAVPKKRQDTRLCLTIGLTIDDHILVEQIKRKYKLDTTSQAIAVLIRKGYPALLDE